MQMTITYRRILSRVRNLQIPMVERELLLEPLHAGLGRLPEPLLHGLGTQLIPVTIHLGQLKLQERLLDRLLRLLLDVLPELSSAFVHLYHTSVARHICRDIKTRLMFSPA